MRQIFFLINIHTGGRAEGAGDRCGPFFGLGGLEAGIADPEGRCGLGLFPGRGLAPGRGLTPGRGLIPG